MTDERDETGNGSDCPSPIADGGPQERVDEILAALADTHRRYVLYYLRTEGRASLTETARQVAAWKRDCAPTAVDEEVLNSLEIRLYHSHLPLLEDTKLISYDDRSDQVALQDLPAFVDHCLEHCVERDLAR